MLSKWFKERKRSLVGIGIKYLIIYSVILFMVFTLVDYSISIFFSRAFSTVENLLEYKQELINEEYSNIPIEKFRKSDFVVYDESGRTIYASSKELNDLILYNDTHVLENYEDNLFYQVYRKKNTERHYIFMNEIDENGRIQVVQWCAVEKNKSTGVYDIIAGDLFSDKKFLTAREFGLVKGKIGENSKEKKDVFKIEYDNNWGEKRILVYLAPDLNDAALKNLLSMSYKRYFIIIPIVIVLVIVHSCFLKRRVIKEIKPVNNAVMEYRNSKKSAYDMDESGVKVKEFSIVMENFYQMTRELDEERREKEKVSKEKQKIITDISHDIKTPLTTILGYSRAVSDGVIEDKDRDIYLKIIYQKAVQANDMLNSLFEYSKLSHPDMQMNIENVNLPEVFREYLIEIYNQIEREGFYLDVDITEKPIQYRLDRKLFFRVIDNIVQNSIKYNTPGTTIYVKVEDVGKNVLIEIGDNGKGIPNEIRDTVFQPFVTENNARTSGKGSGLGLSIVKKIVDLMNGSVELTENRNYITVFRILLPK